MNHVIIAGGAGYVDGIIKSRHVVPRRLTDDGFEFVHATLPDALAALKKAEKGRRS